MVEAKILEPDLALRRSPVSSGASGRGASVIILVDGCFRIEGILKFLVCERFEIEGGAKFDADGGTSGFLVPFIEDVAERFISVRIEPLQFFRLFESSKLKEQGRQSKTEQDRN